MQSKLLSRIYINIFSVYYETVAGQIRLWRAATRLGKSGYHQHSCDRQFGSSS